MVLNPDHARSKADKLKSETITPKQITNYTPNQLDFDEQDPFDLADTPTRNKKADDTELALSTIQESTDKYLSHDDNNSSK